MPVLILGEVADLDLIRPLAARLRADGGEVRGYLDDDDYELRNMGCKLAVGRLDDEVTLEGALRGVHTFIPVLPDPLRLVDESALSWFELVGTSAATAAGAARIPHTILAMPGVQEVDVFKRVESMFEEKCHPLCTIRTGLLWGPERPLPQVVRGLGSVDMSISILRLHDWVMLLAAVDDRESVDGTWELSAPPASVSSLQQTAGAGPAMETPYWWPDNFNVGDTAAKEFRVHAEAVRS